MKTLIRTMLVLVTLLGGVAHAQNIAGNWQGTVTVTLTAQKDNEAPESGSAPTTYRMSFNLDGKMMYSLSLMMVTLSTPRDCPHSITQIGGSRSVSTYWAQEP